MVGFQNTSIFGKAGSIKTGKSDLAGSAGANPPCPQCGSPKGWRDGLRYSPFGDRIQRWLCRDCGLRFSDPEDIKRDWSTFERVERIESKSLKSSDDKVTTRQICVKETKNLAHVQEIKTCTGEESLDVKGKLVQFAFYCQKEGMTNSTIVIFNSAMKRLLKVANLNDPESVKEALAKMDVEENTKVSYCIAYTVFLRFMGKTWLMPKYTFRQKLPEFLPTEEEIDQLIAGTGRKVSTLLQLIKETGMRIGECLSITWICINFENRVVTLTTAEKRSLPRVFKVSTTLVSMLGNLPKQNEKVFGKMTRSTAENCLRITRKKVAAKISNPRIAKIHYHLIRHWFGTIEYHKKPDMDHVRRLLGHKSILNTQIYVNMEKALFSTSSDEYVVKVASTVEEACKLIEVGFEHITEMDGKQLFRKRK